MQIDSRLESEFGAIAMWYLINKHWATRFQFFCKKEQDSYSQTDVYTLFCSIKREHTLDPVHFRMHFYEFTYENIYLFIFTYNLRMI